MSEEKDSLLETVKRMKVVQERGKALKKRLDEEREAKERGEKA